MRRRGVAIRVACLSALTFVSLAGDARAGEPDGLPPEYLRDEVAGLAFAYHPSARERVRPMVERAQEVRAELRERLGHDVLPRVDVRVAVHPTDLARTLSPGRAGSEAAVLVDAASSTVALTLAGEEIDAVAAFRGGLAALALEQAAAMPVPGWLERGFVDRFAAPGSAARSVRLLGQALVGAPFRLAELEERLRDPELTVAAVAEASELAALVEEAGLPRVFASCRAGEPFGAALGAAVGLDAARLEAAVRARRDRLRLGAAAAFASLLAIVLAAFAWSGRMRRAPRRARAALDGLARLDLPTPVRRLVQAAPGRGVVRRTESPRPPTTPAPHAPKPPKISHDGRWHTLH